MEGRGLEQLEALCLLDNLFCHLYRNFMQDFNQLLAKSGMQRHLGVIVKVEVNHLRVVFEQHCHLGIPYGEALWL